MAMTLVATISTVISPPPFLAFASALQAPLFRQSTGNNVSGPLFWHERAAFQRSAFGRSTAGNNVVTLKYLGVNIFSDQIFFWTRD